jgi:hypothetical protein
VDAFRLILVSLAGWMNRQQQNVIEYLQEEIRVLKEQHGSKRIKFTDEQRARLARKATRIRFGKLAEIASLLLGLHSRILLFCVGRLRAPLKGSERGERGVIYFGYSY